MALNKRILVLCPSRSRPRECLRMVDSFNATAKRSSLHLLLDMDDPCLDEYRLLVGGKVGSIVVDFQQTITKLINSNWGFSADCFRWFSVTNDDFVYRTDGWDEQLIARGPGIAYGNDLCAGVNMPTTSIISREIVEALGWLQLPTLTHLYGDCVWKHIGTEAKCLFYSKDVIIEHCHYFSNKAVKDETYRRTNSDEMYSRDSEAFKKWKLERASDDVEKIKAVLKNKLK